jgi:hypothetical protein
LARHHLVGDQRDRSASGAAKSLGLPSISRMDDPSGWCALESSIRSEDRLFKREALQ